MKVSVDGRAVVAAEEGGPTLDALLHGLRESGEIARGRVVVGLAVDDRSCSAEDLNAANRLSLREVGEVRIATDGADGYVRRILTDANGMLLVLEEAAGRVAGELRGADVPKANEGLLRLLNALHCFVACLYHVDSVSDRARASLDPYRPLFAGLAGCLDRIQSGQERQDWPAVAAGLERDLPAALAGFAAALRHMQDSLA